VIDRLVLSVVLGTVGINGLLPPDPPSHAPLTARQLKIKAVQKSVSEMCQRKNRKSTKAKEICKQWERQNA
jgi:hypothetical protein